MLTPGIRSLGDVAIAAAGTQTTEWVTGLEGVLALTAQLRFLYGTGGEAGSVKAYLQTSIDQGATAIDVAAFAFAQTAEAPVINLSGLTPKTTQVVPTDGALTDDTAVDGILGDRFRLKVISTGTYANTMVSARICAR